MSGADMVQPQLPKQPAPSTSSGIPASASSSSTNSNGRGGKPVARPTSAVPGGLLSSLKLSPGLAGAETMEAVYCKYTHRTCTQDCVAGYDFCLRHILEDKTAPFKQCAYMSKAGRRCTAAAPKIEKKEGFCATHNRKSILARQRLARKRRPGETAESLLEELATLTSGSGSGSAGGHEHRRNKMFTDSIASRALEYGSSSDSESEMGQLVEQTWYGDGDSDAESIDSDQEDLLKYAGIYTTEEVAQILRDKLIRLQALYIDQFKRLKYLLLSKRRQYLRERAAEKEAFGSIKLYKKDPVQREKYNKLKAMQRIHKKLGKEALLHQQATQRRMQASSDARPLSPGRPVFCGGSLSGNPSAANFPACTFLDEGVRCGARVVPLSKFCQKHILHDPQQLLYRPCPFADSQCGRPVPTLLNTEFCSLHQPQPAVVKVEADEVKTEETNPAPEGSKASTSSATAAPTTPETTSTIQAGDVKPDMDTLPTAGQSENVAGASSVSGESSSIVGPQLGEAGGDMGLKVELEGGGGDMGLKVEPEGGGGDMGLKVESEAEGAGGDTGLKDEAEGGGGDMGLKVEPGGGRKSSVGGQGDEASESEPKGGVRFTLGEADEEEDQEMDNQGR